VLDLRNEHKNLEQRAYEIIKDRILSGKLKPNIRLKEVEMARQLNVSRTTIKMAFVRLKEDYLLENAPTQGLRVKLSNFKEILEAFEIREVLEGLASRIAARSMDKKTVDDLMRKFRKFKDSKHEVRNTDYIRLNFDMHQSIADCCLNEYISKSLISLLMQTKALAGEKIVKYRTMAASAEEHLDVLQAIKKRDQRMAENLMRKHIKNIKKAYVQGHKKD
jgi:DNA-binding GntR family transcriptional regulator